MWFTIVCLGVQWHSDRETLVTLDQIGVNGNSGSIEDGPPFRASHPIQETHTAPSQDPAQLSLRHAHWKDDLRTHERNNGGMSVGIPQTTCMLVE